MNEFQPVRFGKYLLIDKIATGGMAELFRAKKIGVEGFEKLLAVKRILPHLSNEEDLIKAFIDEAKLAALLSHQSTIQIFDFGSIGSSYFIAMEYLFGRDLRLITRKAKAKNLPLTLAYSLYIVSRICAGLDYAHSLKDYKGEALNVVHRDISPQNIIVTYEGEVKIVDFGIAKAATRSFRTQVGMIKGKVAYMSPEQAEGHAIDYRSDIFSTGILLYEMTTGKRMFKGDTLYILSKVRKGEFLSPEEASPDLPSSLFDILHRALAKNPEDRYQSCGDMQSDIEECIQDCGFKPNARGLAQYMKELFADEIKAEYRALRNVTRTVSLSEKDSPDKKKLLTFGIPIAAGLILVVALLVVLWPEKSTVPEAEIASPKETKTAELIEPPKETIIQTDETNHEKAFSPSEESEWEKSPPPESTEGQPDDAAILDNTASEGVEKTSGMIIAKARAAFEANKISEALFMLEELLQSNPERLDEVSNLYSSALEERAVEIMDSNPVQSEELLRKAVEINPVSVSAYSQLGFLYVTQKNYEKAIENYEIAAGLGPEEPDPFFNLGYIYAVTKDYSRAEAMYSRAVELNPVYLDEALFNLAVIQDKRGKSQKALENLEKAISVNPDNELAKKYIQKLR